MRPESVSADFGSKVAYSLWSLSCSVSDLRGSISMTLNLFDSLLMSTVCCHGFGILEATGRQVRRPIIQGTICM